MRVFLDLTEQNGEHYIVITAPGRSAPGPPVRWTAGHRLLVAKDEQISDTEAAALASSVDASGAHAADLERYGRLLFKAAFYEETWRQLVADAATEPYLELAIRGPAGSASRPRTRCAGRRCTTAAPRSPRAAPR